jgi:hypothetical protein
LLKMVGFRRATFCSATNSRTTGTSQQTNYVLFFRCVRKIAKSDCYLRHVSLCPSALNNSASLNGFSWNLVFFFENVSRKFLVSLQSNKNNRYFT